MSYGLPSDQPRRKKGGGGLFFLIILAVGAFLLFSNRGQQKPAGDIIAPPSGSQADNDPDPYDEYDRQRENILGSADDIAKGEKMPSTGGTGAANDWKLEDVNSQKNASSTDLLIPESSKTQKGDWAIEDVDGKKDDNQFKFSDQNKTDPAKSDWTIEDLKANKKTESGDWAIEETTTSDKDK